MRGDRKTGRWWKILLIVIGVLIVIRLILPAIIVHYANKSLKESSEFTGHVEDVDLAIIRGAYKINELHIDKIDSATKKRYPFIKSDEIDISVEWNSLFKGKLVGELAFQNPVVHFSKEVDPEDIQNDTVSLKTMLDKLMPIKLNSLIINNGKIQYVDSTVKPLVDVALENIYLEALNLSSVEDTAVLPASVTAKANVYGGTMNLKMKLDPLAEVPTFDMNVALDNTNLAELNDFFKAYGKFDVNKGTFGLYSEVAGKDNRFTGYVKPIIKDLDIVGPQDRKDSFLNKLWEAIMSLAGSILENKKEEQVASKIPISGRFDNPTVKTWYAVLSILRNAFVQALYPSIENEINLASVKKEEKKEDKSILEKIFDSDKKEDKPKKKDKEKDREDEKDKKKEKENEKEREKQE